MDVSADGRLLLFFDREARGARQVGLSVLPLEGERKPVEFLKREGSSIQSSVVGSGRISPDGRWAAYRRDSSGRREVFVTSFPSPTRKVQISTAGGVEPRRRPALPHEPARGRFRGVHQPGRRLDGRAREIGGATPRDARQPILAG